MEHVSALTSENLFDQRHFVAGSRDKSVAVYSSLTLQEVGRWVLFILPRTTHTRKYARSSVRVPVYLLYPACVQKAHTNTDTKDVSSSKAVCFCVCVCISVLACVYVRVSSSVTSVGAHYESITDSWLCVCGPVIRYVNRPANLWQPPAEMAAFLLPATPRVCVRAYMRLCMHACVCEKAK